ncbi:MAG: DUF2065 domain-containing protein [Magnetococcales bacterium]|nr:DUF2065 domain-containing protein [Magnetococcales bacterium]
MDDFITALGLVCILEGLPWFAVPDRMRAWMLRLGAMPPRLLRVTGLGLMLTGLWLVWLVRR